MRGKCAAEGWGIKSMVRKMIARSSLPLTACGVTLVLLLIGYAVYGLYPFGNGSLVWCDMEQQAVPLLMQLKQMAARGESIGYSALNAGGMRFFGVFFFFLSNPLSLPVLWTELRADLLVNLLVMAKLVTASGTAAVWMRYRVPALRPAQQQFIQAAPSFPSLLLWQHGGAFDASAETLLHIAAEDSKRRGRLCGIDP